MATFDAATREYCSVREGRTNTPLQALNLMNDVTYVEAARKFAERILKEENGGPEKRIGYAFRLATARSPEPEQLKVLCSVFQRFLSRYQRDPQAAQKLLIQGDSPSDASLNPAELASYASVASLILNLDQAITKE